MNEVILDWGLMVDTLRFTKQRAYFGNCGPQLYAPSSQKAPLICKIWNAHAVIFDSE
jgi:hypothetical protein